MLSTREVKENVVITMERNLVALFYEVLSLLKSPPPQDNRERLRLSIEHYLKWLEANHPSFIGEVLQAGLGADGMFSLYVTDKGLGYVERNFLELKESARIKLGATHFNASCGSECGDGKTVGDKPELPEAGMHYEEDDPVDYLLTQLRLLLDDTEALAKGEEELGLREEEEEEESISLKELVKTLNPDLLTVPIPFPFVRCIVAMVYQQVCDGLVEEEVDSIMQNLVLYRERSQLKRPQKPKPDENG